MQEVAEVAKHKAIFFWLTHAYLRRIAKRYPEHFKKMLEDITDSYSQRKVITKRYLEGKKFEAIAYEMNVDVRYIFRLHKQVIEKIIRI